MNYNPISKIPAKDANATYDMKKVLDGVKALGRRIMPVQGSYNKHWIVSKTVDGQRQELMYGSKYYKLVVNSRDFGIEAGGDLNAFSFAGNLRTELRGAK